MNRVQSVRSFVNLWLKSRARLTSPGSPMGPQLEALRNSVDGSLFIRDGGDAGRAPHVADSRMQLHAMLALIWSALNPEEQRVLELMHTPRGSVIVECERKLSEVCDGDGQTITSLCFNEEGIANGSAMVLDTQMQYWQASHIAEEMGISKFSVLRRITTGGRRIMEHPLLAVIGADG